MALHEHGSVLAHDALAGLGDRGQAIQLQAAQLLVDQFFPRLKELGGYNELIDRYAHHPGLYAYVDDDGSVPGAALLNTRDTLPSGGKIYLEDREVRLSLMAVARDRQNSGVGTELLDGVETDAVARFGASLISLDTSPGDSVHGKEREGAIRRLGSFYERRGYDVDTRARNRSRPAYVKRLPARHAPTSD